MKTAEKHLRKFIAEIEKRGGETGIDHAPFSGCAASRTEWRELDITDVGRSEGRKTWLLRVEGWRYYSRRYGSSKAALSYLCGYDDSGCWAVRVPGTIEAVDDAVDWITPRDVKIARKNKKRVLRQGDIYAIETLKRSDGSGHLTDQHTWYEQARVLIHEATEHKHNPLIIPFPVRFSLQKAIGMGRGNGSGAGLAD